jgi:hypothetical protein
MRSYSHVRSRLPKGNLPRWIISAVLNTCGGLEWNQANTHGQNKERAACAQPIESSEGCGYHSMVCFSLRSRRMVPSNHLACGSHTLCTHCRLLQDHLGHSNELCRRLKENTSLHVLYQAGIALNVSGCHRDVARHCLEDATAHPFAD